MGTKKKSSTVKSNPERLNEEEVVEVVDLFDRGLDSEEIIRKTGYGKWQVAGVKAHITRGTYD